MYVYLCGRIWLDDGVKKFYTIRIYKLNPYFKYDVYAIWTIL